MHLAPGRSLGPYEILAPLGAGGMGEVYEAKDTRLGRTVAIKVLPEGLAENPERRARFEREARTVSQLSHPHVCTLYDVGEEEGIHFLVMEHLEGDTLAERLQHGALSLEDTLSYGAQIAEALDAAHRRGVIHRDLKPANVMLTSSGVKLLDFGLARLAAGEAGEVQDLPTLTMREEGDLTEEGTILGTYPYMSPEQVEGTGVDARSDIFALGAVLYEMATGGRAFEGESAASIMASILREEPEPLSEIQPISPSVLDHLVSRCLAKDPTMRWQSALDVAEELRWISESGFQTGMASPEAERPERRKWMAWGFFLGAALATVIVTMLWREGDLESQRTEPVIARTVELPSGARLASFAVSPDGREIVYSARLQGAMRLYHQPLDRLRPIPIPGTEGGDHPFFSPDGASVAFLAGTSLKQVDLDGGDPLTVSEVPSGRLWGGAWLETGQIVFSPGVAAGLWIVSETGGSAAPLTEPDVDTGQRGHWFPMPLPGVEAVVFTIDYSGSQTITVCALPGGETIELREGLGAQYLSSGSLLFRARNVLMVAPFDLTELALSGTAKPVRAGIDTGDTGTPFLVSPNGTLVLPNTAQRGERRFLWMGTDGTTEETTIKAVDRTIGAPRVSPNGDFVANSRGGTVFVHDLQRGVTRAVGPDDGGNVAPVWSPDGRELVFHSSRGDVRTLYRLSLESERGETLLTVRGGGPFPTSWSPDGRFLLYYRQHAGRARDLWVLPLEEEAEPWPFLATPYNEAAAAFSPDGDWVAFVSNRSGRSEVYLADFPERIISRQVSARGGHSPRWSPDGGKLYYRLGDAVYSVQVEVAGNGTDLVLGKPERLFDGQFLTNSDAAQYDVAPDGRLLMVEVEKAGPDEIRVFFNWASRLEDRES